MCDATKVTTRFHVGASYWGDQHNCAYGGSATGWAANRRDKHLHYRCETCRYDWTGDTGEASPE